MIKIRNLLHNPDLINDINSSPVILHCWLAGSDSLLGGFLEAAAAARYAAKWNHFKSKLGTKIILKLEKNIVPSFYVRFLAENIASLTKQAFRG